VPGLNIANLPENRHYCRKANTDFWLDWTKGRIDSFVKKYGDDFCLIFYQDAPPYDYYAIPYWYIMNNNLNNHIHAKRNRWNGSIDKHQLIVRKAPLESIKIDVSEYYNNFDEMKSHNQVTLPNRFTISSVNQRLPLGLASLGETFYRRSNSPEGWLYVITNPSWTNWVKIGITRDLTARLSTYNTGSPYDSVNYEYFDYIFDENARDIEQKIHKKLSYLREKTHSNEWYKLLPEDALEIIQNECK